ncbi:MAG: hypothetical protein ACK5KQ_04750 [Anaerorhabdus sp.]
MFNNDQLTYYMLTSDVLATYYWNGSLKISYDDPSAKEKFLSGYKDIEKYDYLLDYGTIYSFNSDFLLNKSEESYNILKKVKEDDILGNSYIYAAFDKYYVYEEGYIARKSYQFNDLYAIISKSYLDIEKVKLYDEDNKLIDLKTVDDKQDVFIFPKIYTKDKEVVLGTYFQNNEVLYKNREEFKPEFLYYENRFLHTYNTSL